MTNFDIEESNNDINSSLEELENKLISLKDDEYILSQLNSLLRKKELIRTVQFSKAQDYAVKQLSKRLEKKSDEFSNKEILETISTIQTILQKQDVTTPLPTIAIQNNVVVNSPQQLPKSSRDKIMDILNNILQSGGNTDEQQIIDGQTE